MNNSISSTLPNRILHTSFSRSTKTSTPAVDRNAQVSSKINSNEGSDASIMERRMSVVNLEAGLSVQNSYLPEKVTEMSLVYRFGQASRSRISSSLISSSTALRNLTYLG
jgi:hypothetical protein